MAATSRRRCVSEVRDLISRARRPPSSARAPCPQRCRRPAALAAACIVVCGLSGALPAWAQARGAGSRELAKLKAAYVLNFARWTRWPPEAFDHRSSPIVVGVVEDEDLATFLEALVEEKAVHERRIEVQRLDLSALDRRDDGGARSALAGQFHRLHLLFIGRDAGDRVGWLLDHLDGEHVLTVSDIDAFAERGGMLGLVLRNRRLAFDANVAKIERSPLVVSSQVLRLARIVDGRSS